MQFLTAFALAGSLALFSLGALAQQHAHHAPAPAATASAPAHRYTTDATLRQQMREIRGNVVALDEFERGAMTPQRATQAADAIVGHVNTIVANCKLPPDADEALHRIIGSMLQSAATLKADPNRRDAVTALHASLRQYATTFDDPSFSDRRD